MSSAPYAIGVDIGGTSTRAGVVDRDGRVAGVAVRPTPQGLTPLVDGVGATVADALGSAAADLAEVEAIGIGVPGLVDPRQRTVRHAINLGIGAGAVAIGDLVAAVIGVDAVHVENDVDAAALGVADLLSGDIGPGPADLAYLNIGTGIAAGFVVDGRLRRGASQLLGEVGHLVCDPAGPLCRCGQRGCIDTVASGAAITSLWRVADGPPVPALVTAASVGDRHATDILEGVVGGIAHAVLAIVIMTDPEVIALGGGVADRTLLDLVIEQVDDRSRASSLLRGADIARRLTLVDPSVPVGVIGAARSAREASTLVDA